VTSNATVGGTLGVTGATTLSTLGVTSNATVGGTLGVTGATTLSTLDTSGSATLGSASANEIVVAGAAAASAPTITATGSDTNISIRLAPKGTGGIILGSSTSTPITAHYSATFSINFGTVTGQTCLDSAAQTLTGAALGDTVVVSRNVALPASFTLNGFVNAANQVTIRWCKISTGNVDPDSAANTYRVDVWRH
jgi:hypothetical protein